MKKHRVLTVENDPKATERNLRALLRIDDSSLGRIRGGAVTIHGYTNCTGLDAQDCTTEMGSGGLTTESSGALVRRFRAPPHAAL